VLVRPLRVVEATAADGDAVGRVLGRILGGLGRALGATGGGGSEGRRSGAGARTGCRCRMGGLLGMGGWMLLGPDERPVGNGMPVSKAVRNCRPESPPKSVGKGREGMEKGKEKGSGDWKGNCGLGTGAPSATTAYSATRKSWEIMFRELNGKKGEVISIAQLAQKDRSFWRSPIGRIL